MTREYHIHCNNCGKDFYDAVEGSWADVVCPDCGSDDIEDYAMCDICDKEYLESENNNDNSLDICDECYDKYYYNYNLFYEFVQSKDGETTAKILWDDMLESYDAQLFAFAMHTIMFEDYPEYIYEKMSADKKYESMRNIIENKIFDDDDYNYFINKMLKEKKNESRKTKRNRDEW